MPGGRLRDRFRLPEVTAAAAQMDCIASVRPAEFSLAIIGAGPTCTYAIERMAAVLRVRPPEGPLAVHIFDRFGQFGAGETHSAHQPKSSVLNRICGQISFGADDTIAHVAAAPALAPFPSLHQWCLAQYAATGDPVYLLDADSWPRRYLHGRALEQAFASYVKALEDLPNVAVYRHAQEVVDVALEASGRMAVMPQTGAAMIADHVLIATGHGAGRPRPGSLEARLAQDAAAGAGTFVPYAYPLDRRISLVQTGSDKTVCSIGLGLTAIDLILYLTEGRGGQFVAGPAGLEYQPSGAEPAAIVGCSQSGLFTFARAVNEKEADLTALEHRGVFLTQSSVDRLRAAAGQAITIPGIGERLQLDFQRHVLPLIKLEMSWLHYRTLLGPCFAAAIKAAVRDDLDRFLTVTVARDRPSELTPVFAPLVDAALSAVACYIATADFRSAQNLCPIADFAGMLDTYFRSVVGPGFVTQVGGQWDGLAITALTKNGELQSAWEFPLDPDQHRFDWDRLCNPVALESCGTGADFNAAVVDFMELDHRRARQGNVSNPEKAACDGVWRDLRSTLTYVIDHGGLTAASHRDFLTTSMRLHNRLANGACLEVMEKMLALIKCGLLDLGVGPLREIGLAADGTRFKIRGAAGSREVDTIIDSKLHAFDPEFDESALYRSMFARGLIRKWRNPAADGTWFEPGGMDLTGQFHPIDAQGQEQANITFLGPPTEGILFFQVGAARPNQNHHVLNDVITWIEEFEPMLRSAYSR